MLQNLEDILLFTIILFIYYCQTSHLFISPDKEKNHNCPTNAAAHSWLSSEDSASAHLDRRGRTTNTERRIVQKVKDFSFCLQYSVLRSRERSADP